MRPSDVTAPVHIWLTQPPSGTARHPLHPSILEPRHRSSQQPCNSPHPGWALPHVSPPAGFIGCISPLSEDQLPLSSPHKCVGRPLTTSISHPAVLQGHFRFDRFSTLTRSHPTVPASSQSRHFCSYRYRSVNPYHPRASQHGDPQSSLFRAGSSNAGKCLS